MSAQYINYGNFGIWANTVNNRNTKLLEDLHEIQRMIKSLEGEWESNSAVAIRRKIQGMEPRFIQYHDVVDNYAKFLRNTAAEYEATETTNTNNAEQFI